MPKRSASDSLEQPPNSKRAKVGTVLPQSPIRDDTFDSFQQPSQTKSSKRSANDTSGCEDTTEPPRASKRSRTTIASTEPPCIPPRLQSIQHSSSLDDQASEASEKAYWERRAQEINAKFEATDRWARRMEHALANSQTHLDRLPSPISDDDENLREELERYRTFCEVYDLEYTGGPEGRLRGRAVSGGIALQPGRRPTRFFPVVDPDSSPARTSRLARKDKRDAADQDAPPQYKTQTQTNLATMETGSTTRSNGSPVIQPARNFQRRHRRQDRVSSRGHRLSPKPKRQGSPRQIPQDSKQVRRSMRRNQSHKQVFYELDSQGNPRTISVMLGFLQYVYISHFR